MTGKSCSLLQIVADILFLVLCGEFSLKKYVSAIPTSSDIIHLTTLQINRNETGALGTFSTLKEGDN